MTAGAGPLRARPRAATLIDPFELKSVVPDDETLHAPAEESGPTLLSSGTPAPPASAAASAAAIEAAPPPPPPPSDREAWRQMSAVHRVRNVRARRWCSEDWP